ncbi:3'(2'),5'-bisphosphate nucleotidase CysQ [Acinetobacter chinensis]|uniref:3'(2'),5'-bisphosphate nucleotidase CysQ n=1 Tax=Acinetobacter chinensis TaxID=2004650 RepID=A0ABU3WF55_9GAMM|nr:3'(2'),5'-bisphosphate nucleotidase CysQ [Acinetobacter chinensis]MDV2469039.1 3'(2'),5'-bisphosphate nucleotidase CysQ [Acinetobacter chinensis]
MFKITTAPQDALIQKLIPIVTHACEILREEYERYCSGADFDVVKKSDNSPVTQADYRVNSYLTDALAQISELPLLSEEGSAEHRQNWKEFWLLDPLDGTKEFLHKRPEFTINLSMVRGADTVFALLAVPAQSVIYVCPEQGMPLKLKTDSGEWSVFESSETEHELCVGLSHSSQEKQEYAAYLDELANIASFGTVRAGSAYKFCMMLEDQVDIYPRFHPTCEWDTSAGQCLIERIGGGLVDFRQRPFMYNQRDTLLNNGFIAYRNINMKKIALQALTQMQYKH